ncbi:uncharacterized protein LOC119080107 [Bradysia coprophila]|uniref:uncharacterized protein LOC119080107 n=1 Tax=Bradysia coprophila TaxID=38358 RepID=UPI00187DB719|nr:uncharacterized protein LOC119080107 [Bradysia coprophila]
MKCTVNNIEKLGTGPNKKQAKRIAALKVLEAIKLEETTPKGGSQTDEPPVKRLKTSDRSEGADVLLAELVNSVAKAEAKVPPKANLIIDHCNLSTDSNEDDNSDQFSDGCAADDCDEISDTFDLYSTDSKSDSSGTSEDC